MKPKIKIAFASGTGELNRRLIEQMRGLFPELPLYVVSDFPPEEQDLKWIRYRVNRGFMENLLRCREELRGVSIQLAAVMLVPGVPFRRMRLIAILLSPRGFLAFNDNADPPTVEDVVCLSVHGSEAVVGTRIAPSSTSGSLYGLRAGIDKVRSAYGRDPTTCAAYRPGDLPARDIDSNATIHDAP